MVNYYKSRVNTVCFPGFALENHIFLGMGSETHTYRQANPHGCLPSLLGDWDKGIVIVYGVRKKTFCTGSLEQQRQNKNIWYRHDKPKEPTKKGPLPFVLIECPFTSVSTVSRGHPSL
jgi:hypothetical protein